MDYKNYHRDKVYSDNESLFRNIFRTRFDIAKRCKAKGRILDVGASTGVMLDIFGENGWETWGIEPSTSANIAKEKKHKILKTYFEKANLPINYFDLVIMNHTLEHLDDPILVLKKVYKILKKSGVVLIDVPNAAGLGAKVLGDKWPYKLPEEHKHQFTKKSLSEVFRKANFEVIHFESRSGIFEMADPIKEIFESLVGMKKRFFSNVILLPYSWIATILNIGDSMTMVGRKI